MDRLGGAESIRRFFRRVFLDLADIKIDKGGSDMEDKRENAESLVVSDRCIVGDFGKSGTEELNELDFVDDGYLEIRGNVQLHIKKLINGKKSKRTPYEFYIIGDPGKAGNDSREGEDGSKGGNGVQTMVEITIDDLEKGIHVVTTGGKGGAGGNGMDGYCGGDGMDAQQGCCKGQYARGASGGDGTDGFGKGGDGGDGGDAPDVTISWKKGRRGAKILCESRPSAGGAGGKGGRGGAGGKGGRNGDGKTRAADGKPGADQSDGTPGKPGNPVEVTVIHGEKGEER